MRYKMNLGGSTLIVDIPHPLFLRAQTTESDAHRQTAKLSLIHI